MQIKDTFSKQADLSNFDNKYHKKKEAIPAHEQRLWMNEDLIAGLEYFSIVASLFSMYSMSNFVSTNNHDLKSNASADYILEINFPP